jgi:SAM-dependent methyltransferase
MIQAGDGNAFLLVGLCIFNCRFMYFYYAENILLVMKNYVAINRDSYNLVASEYSHKMVHQAEYQQEVLNPLMKHLHKSIEPPIKVLDIGCGVGINSKILVRNGFNVEGIDVAKKMISYARYNVPQAKFREACFLESKFSRIYHGV